MSSPDTGSRKTAKPGTAKTAKIGKAAAKPAATKRARPVDSDGLGDVIDRDRQLLNSVEPGAERDGVDPRFGDMRINGALLEDFSSPVRGLEPCLHQFERLLLGACFGDVSHHRFDELGPPRRDSVQPGAGLGSLEG